MASYFINSSENAELTNEPMRFLKTHQARKSERYGSSRSGNGDKENGSYGNAHHETPNGWFGEPHVEWQIDLSDSDRLQQIAGFLSRVLQARHR